MGMNEGSEGPSVAKDSADGDGGKLSEMNILRVCTHTHTHRSGSRSLQTSDTDTHLTGHSDHSLPYSSVSCNIFH